MATCEHASARLREARGEQCNVCFLLGLASWECHNFWGDEVATHDARMDARVGEWRDGTFHPWESRDEANAWAPIDNAWPPAMWSMDDAAREYFESALRRTATMPCPPTSSLRDIVELRGADIGYTERPVVEALARIQHHGERIHVSSRGCTVLARAEPIGFDPAPARRVAVCTTSFQSFRRWCDEQGVRVVASRSAGAGDDGTLYVFVPSGSRCAGMMLDDRVDVFPFVDGDTSAMVDARIARGSVQRLSS